MGRTGSIAQAWDTGLIVKVLVDIPDHARRAWGDSLLREQHRPPQECGSMDSDQIEHVVGFLCQMNDQDRRALGRQLIALSDANECDEESQKRERSYFREGIAEIVELAARRAA